MNRRTLRLAGCLLALGAMAGAQADDPFGLDDYRYAPENRPPASAPAPRSGGAPAVAPTPAEEDANLIPAIIGLPPQPAEASDYRIGPQDLLTVEVFQVPELSSRERVDAGGNIVMPLIGSIEVGGLTRRRAEDLIAAELARDYMQNPQVNIFIEEYASQRITVAGAVVKPGVFPITGPTTLVQALAMAGGVTPVANEEEILLFRKFDNGDVKAYVINLEKIARGELRDPELIGFDRVMVPESGSAVFFKGITDTLRGFVRLPVY